MKRELIDIELNIDFIINELNELRSEYGYKDQPLPIKVQADLNRYSESLLFLSQAYRLLGGGDIGKEE